MEAPEAEVNTRPAPILTRLNETLALSVQKQLNRAEIGRAVDIRPPATAILTINSADRYKPSNARYNNPSVSPAITLTSPADFTINVPQNIMNGSFTRIAVTNLIMPWTWGAFTPTTSYLYINWQPGGTGAVTQYLINTQTSFITPNGTNLQLAINIQAAVRSATGSTTFTAVSSSAFYFTFASNNTDKFYFSRWISPSGSTVLTAFDLMGFNPQQILATAQNNIYYYSIFRTQFVDIVCETITGNQNLRDSSTGSNSKTLLTRVYLYAENISQAVSNGINVQPYLFVKSPPIPKQISWPANQPIGGTLRIQLLDDRGNVLSNGGNYTNANGYLEVYSDACMADWSMTLQFTEQ